MGKEKCEICDKFVDEVIVVPRKVFEKIGYKIPIDCLAGTTFAKNIYEKIKEKNIVKVGVSCDCDKIIAIAQKYQDQENYYKIL